LISFKLLKLRSAVLRTAVIGKLSLELLQHPLHGRPQKYWEQRRNFAYAFQVANDAM